MQTSSILVLGVLVTVGVSENILQLAQQTLPGAFGHGLAAATVTCSHDFSYGGAPEPTRAPDIPLAELIKRQAGPTSVCGLVAISPQLSYTCNSGYVCGFETSLRNAFGCCSSYLGGNSVTGCYLPTVCYDYSDAATASCASSDFKCLLSTRYCFSSAYPYCGSFFEGTLTALDCFKSPGIAIALIPFTDTDSASGSTTVAVNTNSGFSSSRSLLTTSVTSSRTIASTNSASGLISVNPSDFGDPQTRTNTQAQTVSITTPTSTSSRAMGVSIQAADQTWVAYLLSFFLLAL